MLGIIVDITQYEIVLGIHDVEEERYYHSKYPLEILEEQRYHIAIGDIIEVLTNPLNDQKIARIRGRNVFNRFEGILERTLEPERPVNYDPYDPSLTERVGAWNRYVLLERIATDRFRQVKSCETEEINWVKEGF